jgi:hypothetical protein
VSGLDRVGSKRGRRARRAGRTLSAVPDHPPERRVGERERAAACRLLSAAAAEGRFGSSDQLERRLGAVAGARTRGELAKTVGDLDQLVPSAVRERILRAIARAHAAEELDYAEFLERTDRALPALTYREASALVEDLGEVVAAPGARPTRAGGDRWRPLARRVGLPAMAGGLVGAGVVTVPVAVALPSELGAWVPVVVLTGAFSAVGTVVVAAALRVRQQLNQVRGPASGSKPAAG